MAHLDKPGGGLGEAYASGKKPRLNEQSRVFSPRNEDSSSRYHFSPLKEDEIRLLVLHRTPDVKEGPDTFPWRGSLVCKRIKDCPPYVALSYAWGDPRTTFPSLMDAGTASIPVTKNLWQLLEQHAENFTGQMLWIDQVSINQYDLEEKSHQVQQMARIYESAHRTLIWLGQEDSASDCVIHTIKKMDVTWAQWQTVLEVSFEASRSEVLAFLQRNQIALSILPLDERLEDFLGTFLKRSWFSRLWVLQEAVLSGNYVFLCGSLSCLSIPMLCGLWTLTRIFHSDAPLFMNTISCVALLKLAREKNQHGSLFDLLELTRTGLHCTDPRDKIYALISLQSAIPASIVDYTLNVQEVYTSVARHHISTSGSLNILGELYMGDVEPLSNLPSWVPNWSCINEAGVMDKQSRFQACKGNLWRPLQTENPKSLVVEGNIIDIVDRVESPRSVAALAGERADYRSASILRALVETISHRQGHMVKSSTSRANVVLTRTLTLGGTAGVPGIISDEEVERVWETLIRYEKDFSDVGTKTSVDLTGYRYKINDVCSNRTILWPSKYPIALGPRTTQSGDVVCILHGSTVLVVLRPCGSDWTVVGQCYLDGAMLGEACTWLEGEARAFNIV